jgi:hypothetical protein
MRSGMSANDMTALVEITNLMPVHKTRAPNPVRSNEEMARPAEIRQLLGCARVRSESAIIKCQQNAIQIACGSRLPDTTHGVRARAESDRIEVIPQVLP